MKRISRLIFYIRKIGILKALRRTLIAKADSNRMIGFFYRMIDAACVNKYKDVSRYGFNSADREQKIIVSLTTIPERINYAALVIGIMLCQTMKPDKIQLYLGKSQFADVVLPPLLREQERVGVEIFYVEDLRPHTKYFYALQKYPNDIVITVDDDILYGEDLIENLMDSYRQFPKAVSAMRVHQITFTDSGSIAGYNEWKYCCSDYIRQPRMDLLATGVGGVLYPPGVLPQEVFRKDIFAMYCPYADDIWLKVVQALNGIPCVLSQEHVETQCLTGSQQRGLYRENVMHNKNDSQLEALADYYRQNRNIDVEEVFCNSRN